MPTVLVTGGAGFIGSCFVRRWLAAGRGRVVNVDKLTYAGHVESLAEVFDQDDHLFVEADINQREVIEGLLETHRPEAVVHFAAESHVDRSIDGPEAFIQTNIVGTFALLEAVRGWWRTQSPQQRERFRFVQISTDEVYGSLGPTGKFREETPYDPSSPYSASKAGADHLVRAYGRTYGLPVIVTHCSNNYGPCQSPEKLIPLMILNAVEGKPLPIYGDGQQVRDWLYVEDHCEAIEAVIAGGRPGEIYNIGGDCEKTNREVVETVCATVDRLRPDLPHRPCASLIRFVADRPGHDRRYAIDPSKIRCELGWRPRHDFASGLETTVCWYLEHPQWVEAVSRRVERCRRGLGDGVEPLVPPSPRTVATARANPCAAER